jgi:sugar phosphate isomerase/epimerase
MPATERVCGVGDEAASRLADQLRIHRELGLAGIELRTVEARGLHRLSDRQADALALAVAESGLTVPVVDTPVGGWAVTVGGDFAAELAILRLSAVRAALLGCRRMRVMSYPNDGRPEADWRAEVVRRLRELTALAADLGVTLLHENCHGWAGGSAERTLALLEEVASPSLRLLFDTGNGVAYGYSSTSLLSAVLPYVEHVHIKDGTRRDGNGGGVAFVPPGDGEGRLPDCLRLLRQAGYRGWYSLEPHVAYIPHLATVGQPAQLEAGYRACVRRFAALLAEAGTPATMEAAGG